MLMTSTSILKLYIPALFQFIVTISSAQDVTISPVGQVKVLEGETLNITCTDGTSDMNGNALAIDRNGQQDNSITKQSNGAEATFFLGPFTVDDTGTVFRCAHLLQPGTTSPNVILDVQYPPKYTAVRTAPNQLAVNASVSILFNVDGNPTPQNPILWKDGRRVVDNRVSYSVNEVNITDIQCDDGGQYSLQSSNTAGVGSGNFTLNIEQTEASFRTNTPTDIPVNKETTIYFAEYLKGCPDNITITCTVPNMSPLIEDVVDISKNTSVIFKRNQFTNGTSDGNVTISCTATNEVGSVSNAVNITVTYDAATPSEVPSTTPALGPGEIAGIAVGSIVGVIIIVGIVIAIIVCIKFCCCSKES